MSETELGTARGIILTERGERREDRGEKRGEERGDGRGEKRMRGKRS